MEGLEALLPTGGIAAVLAAIILYLLRANTVDRKDYREAVADWHKRWEDAVTDYHEIQDRFDAERELRRKAEDQAARATIAAEHNAEETAALRKEIELLRQKVTK